MKKFTPHILFLIVAGILAVDMTLIADRATASATPDASYSGTPTSSAPHETLNPGSDSGATGSTAGSSASGTYTLAEVATHSSPSNCWTTINGGVYDVTKWIDEHPGGSQAIIYLCGIDGSEAFNGQHGGQARPASELASFKIGTLK